MARAFQDCYPDALSHCYGCGRNNPDGLQLKSYWDGDETVARYTPAASHIAIPGFVYGGLIASLVDCHGTGSAAAAWCRANGCTLEDTPSARFVTASLTVDYLAPTPHGPPIELRGVPAKIGERKVVVDVEVRVEESTCARGRVIAVMMPASMLPAAD